MKRHLLILCILLGLVGTRASAYDFEVDGIYYNIISASESTCEVTKGDVEYFGDFNIPASVDYENQTFSVIKIGDYAFYGNDLLNSITIPNSVISIGTDAFNGTYFNNLTSLIVEEGNTVYDSRNNCNAIIEKETNKLILGCKSTIIPNSVTSIKSYAFNYLNLTNITIPNSITNIEHSAFYSSTSELTNIVVEEGNTVYDSRGNCNAIIEKETNKLVLGCKNTIIPNSVTSIGAEAFSRCYSLQEITIPNSVTNIGAEAFSCCYSLQEITIPNSVNSIEYSAFYYCGLTDINIPSSVTTIGSYAFCYCSSLTNVTIPNSVTTIGTSAFDNCSSLTSITIPNSVTTIEVNTFYDCN